MCDLSKFWTQNKQGTKTEERDIFPAWYMHPQDDWHRFIVVPQSGIIGGYLPLSALLKWEIPKIEKV